MAPLIDAASVARLADLVEALIDVLDRCESEQENDDQELHGDSDELDYREGDDADQAEGDGLERGESDGLEKGEDDGISFAEGNGMLGDGQMDEAYRRRLFQRRGQRVTGL